MSGIRAFERQPVARTMNFAVTALPSEVVTDHSEVVSSNTALSTRVLNWIYEGELSIEYQKTLVAKYRCEYDRRHGQLQGMSDPTLYTTTYTPPQLELIELDDEQWVKFQQRPARTYSKRIAMLPKQLPLIDLGASALILLALKAM